jgi:hypothetical protein
MTCLSTAKKIKYQNLIDQWESILASYLLTLTGSLSTDGVKEYRFDAGGGEASQMAKRFDPDKLLKSIGIAEKYIESYEQKLEGQAIVDMNMRRQARALIC